MCEDLLAFNFAGEKHHYKCKSTDFFNIKETLGLVNRFFEGTLQH